MDKVFMNVSIVIPVYNEAERLGACLAAIDAQATSAYEVIVVNNNSTDETADVARQFPFVTLIHEPRQGVIHARTTGFNAATGDIIARIDADTLLPPEWLSQMHKIMSDRTISAVSGAPHYHDFALPDLANAIDHYWRQRLADKLANTNFLHGANMAMRREAWLAVRQHLCAKADMHEDFDLAIHLQDLGYIVTYEASLIAGISSRRINTKFGPFLRYTLVSPRTYALHQLSSRRHMYPALMTSWLCHLPGRLLHKAYDPQTARFSLSQFLLTSAGRVDPTSHVA